MKVSDLDYGLPKELLAREPREIRGESRSDSKLLVMNRKKQSVENKKFCEINSYFKSGDILVLNNSKTINAIIIGTFDNKSKIEVQLCGRTPNNEWQCYIPIDRNVFEGGYLNFKDRLTGKLTKKIQEHLWLVEFNQVNVIEIVNEIGKAINSHYMSQQWNLQYYQNVYASVDGSSELPAAGRHFTDEILEQLRICGVEIVYVTLHTGLSSVTVEEENFESHTMHFEEIEVSKESANVINQRRKAGGRLFAVGTTVVRTLETVSDNFGVISPYRGFTNLYIYPGYKFKVVDAFITNFHGPRSTRIAMAAAFSGEELLKKAYDQAIKDKFLFYEFGDATLTI